MPVSVTSNLSASYAQRALRERSDAAGVSIQRLSSGQRVFRADQDAAALAVGSNLKIENAALNSARVNASGAISALQIVDGALTQLDNLVTRMKVLAVQAGSANLSDPERALVDKEFQALLAEVDRLANDTEFNGVFPLKGSAAFTLHGAANYGGDGIIGLTVGTNGITADAVFRYSYDSTTEQLTMTRVDAGATTSQTIDITGLMDNLAGAGNNLGAGHTLPLNFGGVGVTLTLGPAFDRGADILPTLTDLSGPDISFISPPNVFEPATMNLGLDAVTALQGLPGAFYSAITGDLTLPIQSNGTTVTLGALPGISYTVNGTPTALNTASADFAGGNAVIDVYIDTASGPALLGRVNLQGVATTGTTGGSLVVSMGQGVMGAEYSGDNAGTTMTYMVGSGVIAGQDLVQVRIPAANTRALGLALARVDTLTNATAAIDALSLTQDVVYQTRAEVGAQQSRLEMVMGNLNIIVENNERARSTLMDTDASEEIVNLTTQQAMLEVGVSMLSQANQIPKKLLELLRQ